MTHLRFHVTPVTVLNDVDPDTHTDITFVLALTTPPVPLQPCRVCAVTASGNYGPPPSLALRARLVLQFQVQLMLTTGPPTYVSLLIW